MIRHILKISVFLLFLWILFAFDVPSNEWYVTDKVGVFSQYQKASLVSKIEEIEKTTWIEMAILVVATVDDDINLVAADVGNIRGVGKEGQDNWVVVLIAIDDRKRSIQVGYWLEGTLPDLIADRIGETNFPPNFRNGDYYAGVLAMIDDFLWYIAKDPTIVHTYSTSSSNTSWDEDMIGIVFFVLIILMGWFGRWITIPKMKGSWRKMRKYGRLIYSIVWFALTFLVMLVIASFVASLFLSYLLLLFGILMAMFGRNGWWRWGMRFGGSWDSWWWWSGFGWFGGGSFWGGGSSGSR
jgi:uncharacterized protein